MNKLAVELNSVLEETVAARLMSPMGKRLYFPKGIIAQSAEAKKSAHTANATIGTACSKGIPLVLSAVAENMPALNAEQTVAYAPTAGVEKIRSEWKKRILENNKSLKPENFSLPVVVPGLTSGISCMADIFLPENSVIISSDPAWDNYSLIFEERRSCTMRNVPFLGKGPGLDLAAIETAVHEEAKKGAVRIILNFPNNPSGYAPTKNEAQALAGMFLKAAESGADLLILCDDAYFGLFYEENIFRESLFSLFANLHKNILAVKIDGPIKEDFVWGLRIGFVSFGSKGMEEMHYSALVTKLMGAIRSSVSCANTPAQNIILKAMEDKRTPQEKLQFKELLQKRYNRVKAFVEKNPDCPGLSPLPFNSGYFMSFLCMGISAEKLRQKLLADYGIGVVSLGEGCLRVAFSSLDEEQVDQVYRTIYDTAAAMTQGC
ncbi:MAG: aminotransferase class I/II-fold pyridoxal phosphate-dependent enzyme [Treponema sp.]|nr:aminotransferase class I/II-fold pyridoxal phosphate-dependent enzyme [Treponema sp.]